MSGRALSKVMSSFMVLTSDGSKSNLGLSLKFEAKGLKVIEYSRKDGRFWEFSDKAIQLIHDYKVRRCLAAYGRLHTHFCCSQRTLRCFVFSTAAGTVCADVCPLWICD